MELWLGPPSLHLCPSQRQPTWAQVSPLRREERRSQFGIYKSQIIYLSSVHPLEAEQVQVFAFHAHSRKQGLLGFHLQAELLPLVERDPFTIRSSGEPDWLKLESD